MNTKVMDPIIIEVLRNQLISIISEMTDTLVKAAYTPTIYEVLDFSNAIHDENGNVIAQGVGIPIFLGAMSISVTEAVNKIGRENIYEGDVIISNDPYLAGGTHVNDVNIIFPVFFDNQLISFLNCKAHWRDIGGKVPGSWAADGTNIYQEGLRIPPLKIVNKGEWNDELLEIILTNTRLRENALGDLKAQVAACQVGNKRMLELLEQYGLQKFLEYKEEILNHGERLMSAEISEIPNGEYYAEGFVDSDGVKEKPVKVAIKLSVEDEQIVADFSNSDPQCEGSSGNTIYAGTLSAVRLAIKTLTNPALPTNEGSYRPIKVIAPEGTCVNAKWPSAVTVGLGNVNLVTVECVYECLRKVLPNRVIGQIYGGINALQLAGKREDTDDLYIYGAPHSGGWGGRYNKDGINGMMTIVNGDCRNIPAEIIETKYPIRIEKFELIKDSGGPGNYRGGLGIRTDYRVLSDDTVFSTALVKYEIKPKGIFEGLPGFGNKTVVNPEDEKAKTYFRISGEKVNKYDIVSHQMGGGGGYGNPLKRDPQSVLKDVLNEYISIESAYEIYGVVIKNMQVEIEETNRLRQIGGRKS